jgi:hypothetical protein
VETPDEGSFVHPVLMRAGREFSRARNGRWICEAVEAVVVRDCYPIPVLPGSFVRARALP